VFTPYAVVHTSQVTKEELPRVFHLNTCLYRCFRYIPLTLLTYKNSSPLSYYFYTFMLFASTANQRQRFEWFKIKYII